jgi:PAS domain S-box-containing protein
VTLRMVLTYAWLGAAFLLLVWRYDHPMPMSFPAMALTVAGVIALVLIRQIVALNENAGLAARLQTELSERIRATEALRPLEKALATMNLGVTITDPNGTIVYANPAEEEMHGYARGELVGKPARILAPPNLWQPLTPTERANLRSWQRESINVRKDGSRFSVQLLSDVVKNDAGQLIGVVTSCLDITERKQAEEALRDSEARLRRIANNMCDVITEIDIEGTIRYASPSHYWVLGYHTEPLIGQSVLDRLHPDDVDETVAALFKTLAEHTAPESVTFRYQHADGHYLWMECVGNLIMDADGQVTGIVLSSRDVTGRKEAQEALRKLNEELEERIQQRTAQLARANQELQRTAERQTLLYQVLRVISSQLNPDAIARLAMDAIVELTGWYSVSMAVPNEAGTDWVIQAAGGELAGLGGVTRPMSQGVIGRAFRTGQIQLVQDVRIDPDYARESLVLLSELAMPIRHGERVLAVLNLESDRRAAFGAEEVQLAQSLAEAVALALENARLFEAAQLELAERRRVELVLQGTRARLQHLLSDSPTVIYSAEAHGDFAATYVSDNVQALLGYAAVDFLNDEKFWINHIHPEDVERILGGLGPLFQAGYHTHEYRFQHQDDSYRWMHDELRLIRDDQGQPIEIVGSWMDITDRKLAEEQIQTSLREKEVLLKEIHHRVKNNMQVVSSLLNLQADRLQAPASLEVLRESQNRIKSMALIHEKLYQSKDMARVDFADYVRDLTTHLFRAYRRNAKAVTLQVNVSQDVRLGIDTAIPCGLIVNELVSNALKYAFPDGCAGEVRVELARNGGEGFALTVSDNGVGFPPDVDPRKTNSLGLKLVATLTDQLEGSVELDRSAGTLYRITFSEASA